jgi:hypothetical protein
MLSRKIKLFLMSLFLVVLCATIYTFAQTGKMSILSNVECKYFMFRRNSGQNSASYIRDRKLVLQNALSYHPINELLVTSFSPYHGGDDFTPMEECIRKAAENGDTRAQFTLGYAYFIKENSETAQEWFRKAAEGGSFDAQGYAGAAFERNPDKETFEWLRKIAEQGNGWAQRELGWAYSSGLGVKKDDIEGDKWMKMADKQDKADRQKAYERFALENDTRP